MRIDPLRALFSLIVLAGHVLSDVVPSGEPNPDNTAQSPTTDIVPGHDVPTPVSFNPSASRTAASNSVAAVAWMSMPTAGVPLGVSTTISYQVLNDTAFEAERLQLVLCQTNATTESITTNNTWSVMGIDCDASGASCSWDQNDVGSTNITFYPGSKYNRKLLSNFFICFAWSPSRETVPGASTLLLNDLVCAYSSPFFDIIPSAAKPRALIRRVTAAGQVPPNLPIKQNNPIVSSEPDGAANLVVTLSPSAGTSTTKSLVTVSISPTTTVTPAVATASPTSSASRSSSGLSTGAKAGIGIGAALGAIFLAIIAFCLVRRCRSRNSHMILSRSPPMDVPRSMENLAEKMTRSYPNIATPETSRLSQHLYSDQHPDEEEIEPHAVSFYGPPEDSSRPASLVPAPAVTHSRSSSQTQTRDINQEDITRPLSSIARSIHSQQSTRSSHGHDDDDDSFNEPFHDHDHHSPVYGDARHTPVTQVSRSREGVAVFLSEPGMTEEELERLEDEERRIDAAIEEAERSRRNNER
ncbi:hypothetical protein F5884DRAFT_851823 [Xylogone sp. PMI_703]|nr:hypothetical protein F5884DRAFT_851823 [Xylogone sp. PMI_703]